MSSILEKMNCFPVKYNEKEAWYLSPFRQEKTASFHVIFKNNRWHDFGEGTGGDTIDLVRLYLDLCNVNCNVVAALRWLSNMVVAMPHITFTPYDVAGSTERDKTLTKHSTQAIKHLGLIKYIESRGIDVKLARKHLKQLSINNLRSNKRFDTLGLKNEEGGFEIRNPYFKGCVGKKHITFIRGTVAKPDDIHLFEGMFDYLTYLTIKQTHPHDVIVLNSLACLKFATPYIKGYGYKLAATWMDNDLSGQKATEALSAFFKTEAGLIHKPMNATYDGHKDVNAWHMHNFNLI